MNIYSTILTCLYSILIYMMHIWELLIDYIFPPSPEELLVRRATKEDILKEYYPSQRARVYFFCNYQRKLIRATITTAKFTHNIKAVSLLRILLVTWLEEHVNDDTILIPIPLHPKRERKRGYNQVTKVLEQISLPNIVTGKNILTRNRHTTPQTKLDKDARMKNLTDAFSVNSNKLQNILTPNIRRVIICDDVYTTGSTFKEARRVLVPHIPRNCELICLAWAH